MTYLPPMNGGRINATISGNTAGAGALISTGTMTLAGGNNITLSQNGNAVTISGAAVAAGSNTLGMSNLGNSVGTSGVISGSAVRFALAGGNNVTLSQSINASSATITISAASQTVQTQNRFNLTLSGNTAGVMAQVSSGTLTLAGGNNITLSQNGNAVTISGAAGGGGGGIALSNSQTMYSSGTVNLVEGGGAITIASSAGGQSFNFSVPNVSSLSATGALSISTNVSTISIGVPAFSAGISTIGNTAGVSGTASNQVVFAGGNNITLSQSTDAGGNTITINGGAGGGGGFTYSQFDPHPDAIASMGTLGQGSLHIQPVQAPSFQHDAVYLPMQMTNASNSIGTVTVSAWVGLYSRTASSLSLAGSASGSLTVIYSGTSNTSAFSGLRNFSFGWTNTVSQSDYWLGYVSRTATLGNAAAISQGLVSQTNLTHLGFFNAAPTATNQIEFGQGFYTATTSGMPASIAFSQINGSAPAALRPPIIRFVSQSL